MSTMLKTAAMSLLSKTLQTFLYKYLSDVDVEGVELPSLMDVDGHSGWGVRLVNVRLREGVSLLTLPGKRRIRKRPKDSKSKTEASGVAVDIVEPVVASELSPNEKKEPPAVEPTVGAAGPPAARYVAVPVTDYDTSDEGGSDSDGSPIKGRLSFSCFHREVSSAKDTVKKTTSRRRNLGPKQTPTDDDVEHTVQQRDTVSSEKEIHQKGIERSKTSPATAESTLPDDDDIEETEGMFVDFEKDMILRLGHGGCIGVLDVRLVGRELHVSIEDAFLVLEACQKPEEPDNDGDDASTAESTKSDGPKEATTEKKKAPSRKADNEMSVGERVMENSVIARLLSLIPHLFLRDVRVRLVVREGVVSEEAQEEIAESDSVVDFGVELLSVTSGEDFLAHIRAEDAAATQDGDETRHHKSMSSFASFDETSNNEFIAKRIRTGRGPEGGIWLKIFPPGRRVDDEMFLMKDLQGDSEDAVWARQRWMSNTQFCFFRCSGIDAVARIYVGKQEDENDDFFFHDELVMDTMLVGIDYIAPGPAPPLKPLDQAVDEATLEAMRAMSRANACETDSNGIQSIKVKSVFHRVARGLKPTVCKRGHLPCETCSACWTAPADIPSGAVLDHPLDSSIPLAGVVFNLSLNDPLEVNVDRASLEVFGQLQSLFVKKPTGAKVEPSPQEPVDEVSASSTLSGRMCLSAPRRKPTSDVELTDAFALYMQPENIEVMGFHLAKIVVRIHAMRSDRFDQGLSFCYWEAETRCITVDMQKLSSEKKLLDVRVDVGEFTTTEYTGTVNSQLISLGLPQPAISSSDSNSTARLKSSSRSAWPSAAYPLLGLPVPLETSHYESRERHAVQARYISVSSSGPLAEERSVVDVRVGVTSINASFKTKDAVLSVIRESEKSLFGSPSATEAKAMDKAAEEAKLEAPTDVAAKPFLLKCKVSVDGGRVNVYPMINVCLSPTTFFVENSSLNGLFFETMLQKLEVTYGDRPRVSSLRRGSLVRMAALPESVRLRILLFVNDLGPLETALGLEHESNSFLRYRGVNRAIVKVAKRSGKPRRKKSRSRIPSDQREEMLAELLSMDDSALQDLWSLHQHQSARRLKGSPKRKSV